MSNRGETGLEQRDGGRTLTMIRRRTTLLVPCTRWNPFHKSRVALSRHAIRKEALGGFNSGPSCRRQTGEAHIFLGRANGRKVMKANRGSIAQASAIENLG